MPYKSTMIENGVKWSNEITFQYSWPNFNSLIKSPIFIFGYESIKPYNLNATKGLRWNKSMDSKAAYSGKVCYVILETNGWTNASTADSNWPMNSFTEREEFDVFLVP